jgi:hypothetical protein
MNLLTPSNTVYKLIGPALVEQDQSEAKQTVEKRLEFIRKEIERIEKQLRDIEEKSQAKKMEVCCPVHHGDEKMGCHADRIQTGREIAGRVSSSHAITSPAKRHCSMSSCNFSSFSQRRFANTRSIS